MTEKDCDDQCAVHAPSCNGFCGHDADHVNACMATETCQHEWAEHRTVGESTADDSKRVPVRPWYSCRLCGKVAETITTPATEIKYSRDHLEAFVDTIGLSMILSDLSEIASEKAEHVRSNWQDHTLAQLWDRAAHRLDTASTHSTIQSLSGQDSVDKAKHPETDRARILRRLET